SDACATTRLHAPSFSFFINTPPPEIYTLSLHDALPIFAGRSPAADPLASQPTLSRFENMINIPSLKRLRDVFIDQFLASFAEPRSEEHTSELQSQSNLVCRLLLEKKKKIPINKHSTLYC